MVFVNTDRRSSAPWQAPTTILASLTVGTLLAIGHHLFYESLNGEQARANGWEFLGSDVSPQQINVAIGTAFAFLVKAALVTAISTAYLNLLWRALLRAAKGSTLGELDTAFSGLDNLYSLSKVWVWWRLPLLFSLAIVAWLLPLAAIVTPATLSIQASRAVPAPSRLEVVTSLGFESLDFADNMPSIFDGDDSDSLRFAYTIPSREVIEVVKAVAATGSILPITPPGSNASWTVDFTGPTLKCSEIEESTRLEIQENIASATNVSSKCAAYGYIAWLEDMPFIVNPNTSEYEFNFRIFQGGSMPAMLRFAAIPEAMRIESHDTPPAACTQSLQDLTGSDSGATFLQCELLNSTYQAKFNYTNGLQDISVEASPIDGNVIQTVPSVNCTTSGDSDGSCELSSEMLRTLSYQSILDAVTYLITGTVYAEENTTSPQIGTQVISTALVRTPELHFLTEPILSPGDGASAKTLQQNVMDWRSTRNMGLANTGSSDPSSSLASTVEQLFVNATVSLMSQSRLQINASSASAPPLTNVTHETFYNVYTYSTNKLWIAYGAAITVTAISALLGISAVAASGASYSSSNSFSGIFRLARGALLSANIQEADLDGRDPLPEHLSKARMWPEQSKSSKSRVDSMLLSREGRCESIGLSERMRVKSASRASSFVTGSEGYVPLEPPIKSWSAF